MNKILIAVDDPTTRELLCLIMDKLSNIKYNVAKDCFQAIDKIANNKIKLVIISIRMNENYWSEVIETIKILSPETKIIAITNSDCNIFKDSVIQFGAAHILNKPFSVMQILCAVEQFF